MPAPERAGGDDRGHEGLPLTSDVPDDASSELEDLRDLFENAPCGYISTDGDGRITRANKTLAGWIGIDAGTLLGRRFSDLLTMGGRIFYETHFAPMLRMQGSFSEVALDLACADGRKLPIIVNAIERRDDAGHARLIRFTIFDTSERRRYERNLLDAKADAEAASAAEHATAQLREQFLAVLGHDLRNPMASIAAGVRILRREEVSERAAKVLALMDGSVIRGTALIDNMLDFARGRLAGGIGLTVTHDKPLAPVIEQVVAELQAISPGQSILTTIDIPGAVPVDHSRIGQLVSNLVGNAVAHGSGGGSINVYATASADRFELSVANGGEPIPEETLAHLFEPFFRGSNDTNKRGLGLGLHIASEIAKAHGGNLTVASSPEETRFTFSMAIPEAH